MKLNKEEFCIGVLFIASWVFAIGWFTILAPLSGLLWAMSGAGYRKFFRRILCPIMLCLSLALSLQNIWALTGLLAIPYQYLFGYGIPSGYSDDKGSWLGQLWQKILGYDNEDLKDTRKEVKLNLFTKGTFLTGLALCFIGSCGFGLWSISSIIMVISCLLITYKIEGIVKI